MGGGGRGRKRGGFPGPGYYYSVLPREFPFGNRKMLLEGAVVAGSVDGVVYERATFPLGHSCSELLFSF